MRKTTHIGRRTWATVGASLAIAATGGCDVSSLLEVSDPSRLLAETIESPASAAALANGVEADFLCGLGAFIVTSGILTDEIMDTNFGGGNWDLDRRRPLSASQWNGADCTSGGVPAAYVPLSRSRWVADNFVRLLESWTDAEVANRQTRIARASMIGGFSLSALGASYCSAALDGGPELISVQLFAEAEARFTKAITAGQASASADIVNASRLGRARVRLYQGNNAGAREDAASVPTGFSLSIASSAVTPRTRNRVFQLINETRAFSLSQYSRGLMTGGVEDPRSRQVSTGVVGGDSENVVWVSPKYGSLAAPLPVARWQEAQLIIAEIDGGQAAVDIINSLRSAHSLPFFSSTNAAEIRSMVFEERRRELWLEGHRAYDVRRALLPLNPPVETLYQPGLKGGTFGDATCIPIPNEELLNNTTLRGR